MADVFHMTPRYLLAKYVPDLSRMEPRNIGLFLWANGEIKAKFLPKSDAAFVGDLEAFDWWVGMWSEAISGDAITPARGKPVPKTNPSCLDALLTKQEDNYLLVDAGELLEPIGKRELSDAADFLYGDLVALSSSGGAYTTPQAQTSNLRHYCEKLFAATGIAKRDDYHESYAVECPVYGVRKHLKFNHAIGNGVPHAVFQQANLRSQQSVNSSALMLHAVADSATVPKNRCAALAREEDLGTEPADEGLELLSAVCRVIFVDRKNAEEQLLEVAINGDVRAKRSRRT